MSKGSKPHVSLTLRSEWMKTGSNMFSNLISLTSCLQSSYFFFQSLASTSLVMIWKETLSVSRILCTNNTKMNINTTDTHWMWGRKVCYLLSNQSENRLLLCFTDADGIKDLTSCFLHLTVPGVALQFARVVVLLGTERSQSHPPEIEEVIHLNLRTVYKIFLTIYLLIFQMNWIQTSKLSFVSVILLWTCDIALCLCTADLSFSLSFLFDSMKPLSLSFVTSHPSCLSVCVLKHPSSSPSSSPPPCLIPLSFCPSLD